MRSELDRGGDVALLEVEGWAATRSIGAAWRTNAGFAEEYAAIAVKIAEEARVLMST